MSTVIYFWVTTKKAIVNEQLNKIKTSIQGNMESAVWLWGRVKMIKVLEVGT